MPEKPVDRHAKILHDGDYTVESTNFVIEAPRIFRKTKQQEIDESVRRIEELREEIKQLEDEINQKKENAEREVEDIILKAEQEAERLVNEAEKSSFERVKKSLGEKEQVIQEKQVEADQIIEDAKREAERIVREAQQEANLVLEEARRKGFSQGHDEGFEFAKVEIEHMIGRLHSIVDAMITERERILVHSEKQIINLVLSMVEKIVKRFTEQEKDLVINNTISALKLIRGATKVYIHINPDDFDYTLRHKQTVIEMIEGNPDLKFIEDPAIDKGGVYIETDIGEVDATIASQLEEIENKIKFYMPISITTDLKKKAMPQQVFESVGKQNDRPELDSLTKDTSDYNRENLQEKASEWPASPRKTFRMESNPPPKPPLDMSPRASELEKTKPAIEEPPELDIEDISPTPPLVTPSNTISNETKPEAAQMQSMPTPEIDTEPPVIEPISFKQENPANTKKEESLMSIVKSPEDQKLVSDESISNIIGTKAPENNVLPTDKNEEKPMLDARSEKPVTDLPGKLSTLEEAEHSWDSQTNRSYKLETSNNDIIIKDSEQNNENKEEESEYEIVLDNDKMEQDT